MGTEIERKFLLAGDGWRKLAKGVYYCQGYLSTDRARTVRVRIVGDQGFLTVKGIGHGIERPEFEYPIPRQDARTMLDRLCIHPLIEKNRYTIRYRGSVWEVDEFLGENQGLILAEIELASKDQPFARPEWIGREVSGDPRYFNSSLVRNPYRSWP